MEYYLFDTFSPLNLYKGHSSNTETFYLKHLAQIQNYIAIKKQEQILKSINKFMKSSENIEFI